MAITPYRATTDLFRPLLDDAFGSMHGWGGRMADLMRSPEADVVEAENEIRVLLDLPGMRAEDIQVDLENNLLTVSGEKREERREGGDTWHLSERRYGKFSRSFVLPRDVEAEQIRAHFENGVLSVTIPKSERARRRRIEIGSSGGQQRLETGSSGER